jgi:hypothetical protein
VETGAEQVASFSRYQPRTSDEYLELQERIYNQMNEIARRNRSSRDSVSETDEIEPILYEFSVHNHPNPFNPETTIAFTIPNAGNVEINVYNMRGQRVRTLVNDEFRIGHHNVVWNGTDDTGQQQSSGVYFYRIITTENTATGRMVLMK